MLAISLVNFFGTSVKMEDNSMSQTIDSGDSVLIDTLRYKICSVKRFDIVYIKSQGVGKTSIKRVVGLPGEEIAIKDGQIYIDGEILKLEPGMNSYDVAGIAEDSFVLGEDEYFVLGDNGNSSEDSRYKSVGNIKRDNILGKVWFKVSPFGFI